MKRQRLQDTPTDMKRTHTTLEERQWISSKKKFIRKIRRFAGTAASTWMKKRSRKTVTAAASPIRNRAKKHRSYASPEHRRREFGVSQPTPASSLNPALAPNRPRIPRTFSNPDAQEAHVDPSSARQEERSSSRGSLPIDFICQTKQHTAPRARLRPA